jgi:small subunit ribosomal protein S3
LKALRFHKFILYKDLVVGQKTHPLKFRLNTTQDHQSVWYTKFNQYPILLEQDTIIRQFIFQKFKFDSISNIFISRNYEFQHTQVEILTAKPWNIISYGLVQLQDDLKKLLVGINKVTINVIQVDQPNKNANLIADYVCDQLAKRVAFKRVMRDVIKRAQAENVQGIKIQISGRLNGAEMARSEWLKDGRMPLQTLRANIDYASKKSKTIYGIMGVKIWIFNGDVL